VKVYLAKFVIGNRVAYKIGHTKYFHAIKRFESDDYDVFDDISILIDINIGHENALTARLVASAVEATLQAVYPKNFMLEEYFGTPENAFDGLSGITEMFIRDPEHEQEMIDLFARVSKRLYWVMKKGSEYNVQ
jgi:hypothetical protein